MNYGIFTKSSSTDQIDGIRIQKQLVLINGIPFEVKSIYGLSQHSEGEEEGQPIQEGEIQGDNEETDCLVCLCEPRNAIVMPCGHMCVCTTCGNQLIAKKYTCPICRGHISSIVPLDLSRVK
mmetsp:Transcript_41059/g.30198  ORF Transcript_41059/g.30198 Transcript_41059/m.30198 type:complete len:122 (-) Transcript_41059:38-403(-)